MNKKIQEQIKLQMNVHEFLCDRRIPTDKQWDKYFIDNYSDNVFIEFFNGDKEFITYSVHPDHILIKDFIAYGSGLKLFNTIKGMAQQHDLPIRAFVHISNKQVLNILMRRYKFTILNTVGNQYLVEGF